MRFILVALSLFLACSDVHAQKLNSLDQELKRLKTDTALLVPTTDQYTLDDVPLWSPKTDYLAAKVNGKWYKINLSKLALHGTTWRHEKLKIGVLVSKSSVSEVSETEVEAWKNVGKTKPRDITTGAGTRIQLKQIEMSTSLIVTKRGHKPVTLWTTGLENCHSLVLSADEKYVAFIAELNGVVVMKLPGSKENRKQKGGT